MVWQSFFLHPRRQTWVESSNPLKIPDISCYSLINPTCARCLSRSISFCGCVGGTESHQQSLFCNSRHNQPISLQQSFESHRLELLAPALDADLWPHGPFSSRRASSVEQVKRLSFFPISPASPPPINSFHFTKTSPEGNLQKTVVVK